MPNPLKIIGAWDENRTRTILKYRGILSSKKVIFESQRYQVIS